MSFIENKKTTINALLIFYRKLIVPALALSLLLSLTGIVPMTDGIGISFVFLMPMMHYFSYEARDPGVYYFYYNLGLSKLTLWVTTITLSSLTGLLLIVL